MSPSTDETTGQWFRQNFDKILLFAGWLVGLAVVLHMMHHSADIANISWGREAAGTLLGAFLGLVTGSRMGSANAARPVVPPAPVPPPPAAPDEQPK